MLKNFSEQYLSKNNKENPMNTKSIYMISAIYSSLFILLFATIVSKLFLINNLHIIPIIPTVILISISILTILLISWKNFAYLSTKNRFLGVSLYFLILFSPFGDYSLPFLILSLLLILSDKKTFKALYSQFDLLDYTWLVFIGLCFITSITASLDKLSAFGMSCAFLGYGILFKTLRYANIPKSILSDLPILFGSSLISIILFGLFQLQLNQNIEFLGLTIFANGQPGLSSFFSTWPANTAGFLVMSFAILAYQTYWAFVNKESIALKIFFIVSSFIVLIGVLATETRMALLFIIGFMGGMVIFYPFQKFRKIRFLMLLLPIFMMFVLAQYSSKWKETLTNPTKQFTIADRIHQNQYGWKLWKEYPITGVGLMNFRYFYDQYGDPIIKKLKPGHSRIEFLHNIYLSILVETGVFAFLGFCIAIILFMYYLYKNKLYFGLYFLTGVLTSGLVDGWLFVLRFSLMMFIILGFSSRTNTHSSFKKNSLM